MSALVVGKYINRRYLMNLPIIEAIRCSGIFTPIDVCIKCKYHLGINYQTNEINCSNEKNKQVTSRKELYENQYKDFYKDGGIIEFGKEKKGKEGSKGKDS
jgi:hypothetical protein